MKLKTSFLNYNQNKREETLGKRLPGDQGTVDETPEE